MTKAKIFFTGVLLLTATAWGQPDEYVHEVEDSPTSLAALFDDTDETKLVVSPEATPAADIEASLVPPAPVVKKASRGLASVPQYDCAAAELKLNKGQTLSKKEMSAYNKNCK